MLQATASASKKSTTPTAKTPAQKPAARKSAAKTPAEDTLSEAAKKAMAAVAEAAKQLPGTQALMDSGRVTKMAEGGGAWGGGGGADTPPEHHGQKDHPIGHPDCLTKYTFVLSGVLDSMYRHEATDYIKRHGGRVTSAVSGKTSFLLCGALEPGPACADCRAGYYSGFVTTLLCVWHSACWYLLGHASVRINPCQCRAVLCCAHIQISLGSSSTRQPCLLSRRHL